MVIHIYCFMRGIAMISVAVQHFQMSCDYGAAVLSGRAYVYIGKSSSVQIMPAFTLVGGSSAAP